MTQHFYEMHEVLSMEKLNSFLYDYMDETKPNPFDKKYITHLRKDGSFVFMTVNPNLLILADYNKNTFIQYDLDNQINEVIDIIKPYLRKSKIKKLKR